MADAIFVKQLLAVGKSRFVCGSASVSSGIGSRSEADSYPGAQLGTAGQFGGCWIASRVSNGAARSQLGGVPCARERVDGEPDVSKVEEGVEVRAAGGHGKQQLAQFSSSTAADRFDTHVSGSRVGTVCSASKSR